MTRSLRCTAALLFVLASSSARAGTASAEGGSSLLHVRVVDRDTNAPVHEASFAERGRKLVPVAENDGFIVKIGAGDRRLDIAAPGYEPASAAIPEAATRSDAPLLVRLNKHLATIGQTTARPVPIDAFTARASAPSVSDLERFGDVSVMQKSDDSPSPTLISIRNRSERATGVEIDGIPLGALGSSIDYRLLEPLFDRVQIDTSPSAIGGSGSVQYHTPANPRQRYAARFELTAGAYDLFSTRSTLSTASHDVSVLYRHSDRQSNSPLTFQRYRDFSGLDYAHDGELRIVSDLFKAERSVRDSVFSATYLSSSLGNSVIRKDAFTELPRGYGPNNISWERFSLASLGWSHVAGDTSSSLMAFTSSYRSDSDWDHQMLDEVPIPFSQASWQSTSGIAYTYLHAVKSHRFSGSAYLLTDQIGGRELGSRPSGTVQGVARAVARASYETGTKLMAFGRASFAAGGSPASVVAEMGAKRTTQRTTTMASVLAGANGIAPSVPGSLSDPNDARFSCSPGLATLNAPGPSTSATSVHGIELKHTESWTSRRGSSSLTIDLYDQQVNGETLDILETAGAYGQLDVGYLRAVHDAWSRPGVCAGVPFSPDYIVLGPTYGPVRARYRGASISGQAPLWRTGRLVTSWTVSPSYPLDTVRGTTLLRGEQLSGRALHRGYVSVESVGKFFEARLSSTFVGRYNQLNIAPYHVESASAGYHRNALSVTLSANNLFRAQPGIMNFFDLSQPVVLRTPSGAPVLFPSAPLGPRTYSVRITRALGSGAVK